MRRGALTVKILSTVKPAELKEREVETATGPLIMGAVPDDNSWQAHREGYDSRHFMIDWANETAICPQNHASCSWSLAKTRSQRPVMKIKFRRKDCAACPRLLYKQ